MHPCPGNWVAIGRAVVYYARGDQAFSAGIKCRHCSHKTYDYDYWNVDYLHVSNRIEAKS